MFDRRHFIKSSLALGLASATPMMAHAASGFTVTDLKGREKLKKYDVRSIVNYEGK